MNLFEVISAEISGRHAYELMDQITQYYRSPGSGGYHAATNMARNRLIEAGLHVETTQYPLDGKTVVLDRTMPMAWEPYDAQVRVLSPVQEPIINFNEAASCLAWWSCPTPHGGIEAELIDVGTGEHEEDYAGKDLVGKIAYVHNANWHVTWSKISEAIARKGARGIITDFFLYPTPPIRTREKVPSAVQLLRLEFNAAKQFDFWACSVDYLVGQKIRALLKLGSVKVHAEIKCSTFAGHGQNVLATIEGASLPDEAVFVLAHSSAGSRPGANCASGASLLVEIARTLNTLIARGTLARPRRSIKFLLVSEGLGSYNYLHAHAAEIERVKASYCLESVGHDQRKLNTTLYYSRAPDSTPSFVNDHFEAVLERLPKQWGWVGRNEADISPIVVSPVPYTPWSDNSTWAAHGIPSALLMSWPDEYFHSQLLTAEVTDATVFAYAGTMVAASAYEVANAGLAEANWLAQWVFAKSVGRQYQQYQQFLWQLAHAEDASWTMRRLDYLSKRDSEALASVGQLVEQSELPALDANIKRLQQQLSAVKDTLRSSVLRENTSAQKPAAEAGMSLGSVPRKKKQISTPGLAGLDYLEALNLCQVLEQQDPHFADYVLKPVTDEMWNLITEVRNIEEIIESTLLQFNLRIKPESWLSVFKGWQKAGLIAVQPFESTKEKT